MERNVATAAYPVVDAHYDLGMYLALEHRRGRKNVLKDVLLPQLRRGGVQVLVGAVFVDELGESGPAIQQACQEIAAIYSEVEAAADQAAVCLSYQDVCAARAAGKVAILIGFEGAEPLGQDVELLDFFYRAGVRVLGLAHARRNQACDGARYTSGRYSIGGGLTDFGAALIKRARELHMLIDLAHLNDAGTWDVLELAPGPLMVSHSNCRALNPTLRNLSDEELRAVADHGGVIGLNGCNALVTDSPTPATLETLADHADRMVEVAGIDHVGIGLDICGMILPQDMPLTVNGRMVPANDLIRDHGELPAFLEVLRRRGYTDEMLRKIAGENMLRVMQATLI